MSQEVCFAEDKDIDSNGFMCVHMRNPLQPEDKKELVSGYIGELLLPVIPNSCLSLGIS